MDLGSSVDDDLGVRILQWRKISLIQISNEQKAGRIIAAGMTKEVRFEPVRGDVGTLNDEAYKKKYSGNSYLSPMISNRALAATVKIIPV